MKSKKSFILYLGLSLSLYACHYQQDKLVIVNNSNDTICYGTLTKDTETDEYYSVSGDGKISPHEKSSPPVRGTVAFNIQDRKADGNLYVMYFSPNILEKIYQNIDSAAKSGKFKIEKFTKKELDEKNWIVTYNK